MGAALEQAFLSYIPSDKYPFCVLNLEIDPSQVDVNVHPSKLEVKFSNENIVFSAVYYAVRGALATSITRPELYNEPKKDPTPVSATPFPVIDREAPKAERIMFDSKGSVGLLRQNQTLDYTPSQPSTQAPAEEPKKPEVADVSAPVSQSTPLKDDVRESFIPSPVVETPVKVASEEKLIVPDYKIIGEAFNSYVIVELGDIMYLIDKHAAHERIIFEDLKRKTKEASPSSQILMLPIEVYLTSDEISALSDWQDEIKKTGFNFEINDSKVSILEIPTGIEQNACADMLIAFITRLMKGEGNAELAKDEIFEKALYQASCKAAIKAGRIYDMVHIKWICDRVLTLDNIRYCPHGRPVAFEITKHFLEKQFERIK
jgi:DNA mismatch repair protein MutL